MYSYAGMEAEDTDARKLHEERAAILEYDGGLPRYGNEFYACVAVWHYCQRTGAEPPRLTYYCVMDPHVTTETPSGSTKNAK